MKNSELFLFNADSKEGLIEEINNFSQSKNQKINFAKKFKAALVVKDGDDLQFLLKKLLNKIEQSDFLEEKITQVDDLPIYFSNSQKKHKLGFFFPAQGAQNINSAKILIDKFPWAKEISEKIDKELLEKLFCDENEETIKNLAKSENAQVSIVLSSVLWLEFLKKLGIKADAVAGHSLGELMALYEIGVFNIEELISIAILRGQAMGNTKTIGTMVSLACDENKARKIIRDVKDAEIANINSPKQTVVSGTKEAIADVIKIADKQSIVNHPLNVGNAYHSKIMIGAANYFAENFKGNKKIKIKNEPIMISSMFGKKLEDEIILKDHLSKQILSPVKFVSTVEKMAENIDVAIEVGPGRKLSELINKITNKITCFNVESEVGSFFDFNTTIANLFVRNFEINLAEFYKNCEIVDFIEEKEVVKKEEDFIENLKIFAQKYELGLPTINKNYTQEFSVESVDYRPDYQWSGLLNGYSKKFLELAEITEKNTAGALILLVLDAMNKTKLFKDGEKLEITLVANDENNFLFRIGNNENQVLVVTAVFLDDKNNKKIIALIVEKKLEIPVTTRPDKIFIHSAFFNVNLNESNSPENIFKWQNIAFENFIYKIDSAFFKDSNQKFSCVEANVKIFASLEPFDKIEVKLYVENLEKNSFDLSFDFYKETKKIAEGKKKINFPNKVIAEFLQNTKV